MPCDLPATAPSEANLWSLVSDNATRWPDAPALSDGDDVISFAQLRARTLALASRIAAIVPRGAALAVILRQSPAAVIAGLAAQAAGRTCLLLNSDHPLERNATILADGKPVAAVVEAIDTVVPENLLRIGLDDDTSSSNSDFVPSNDIGPDDPALVIYTSGSTGKPKGIVLAQRALLQRSWANATATHLHRGDNLLAFSMVCTIAGMVASIAALMAGACQIVVPIESPARLRAIMKHCGVTVIIGLPGLLRVLLSENGSEAAVKRLRVLRTTGDSLLRSDVADWRTRLPKDCHINVTYGLTEIAISKWFVPPEYVPEGISLPVGYINEGIEFALLDEQDRSVPDSAVGELVLRSAYLALGEWQDGRCVAGRMQPDPEHPRLRIFRTGDMMRLHCDGMLHFVSRRDRQIKIRGQRIEPAEIEAVLREVPGIADAAVVAGQEGEVSKLLGFVTAEDGRLDMIEVRDRLRKRLPSYMVPTRMFELATLPRLPGGKVDQARLLTHAATAPEHLPAAATEGQGASARSRELVSRAWLRVLDRNALAADTPFDRAGGDSLKMLLFLLHLEELSGKALPLERFDGEMRPSRIAIELDGCGTSGLHDGAPVMFLLPGLGGPEPRLARFCAGFASALQVRTLSYGTWSELAERKAGIDALLRWLIARIAAEAPDGPIVLAGYSAGGSIAHAVARGLSGMGRRIAFLGLLDAGIAASSPLPDGAARIVWAWREFRESRHSALRIDIYARLTARLLTLPKLRPVLRLFARLPHCRLPADFDVYVRRWLTLLLMDETLRMWKPDLIAARRLDGVPTVLFRTADHPSDAPVDLGWSAACSTLKIVAVDGKHLTMMDPQFIDRLCAQFGEALAEAEAQQFVPGRADSD